MDDVFDHVTIRASDLEASLRFYELAFAQLGHDASHRGDGFDEWNDFSICGGRVGQAGHAWVARRAGRGLTRSWSTSGGER